MQKDVDFKALAHERIQIFNKKEEIELWLNQLNYSNAVVLFMSSGNFEGIDLNIIAKKNPTNTRLIFSNIAFQKSNTLPLRLLRIW